MNAIMAGSSVDDLTIATQDEQILIELISSTDDPNIKGVLTIYDPKSDTTKNCKNVFKDSKVEHLKKTAHHLKNGNQVDIKLKDPLVSWVVNRINQLMTDTCATCKTTYAVKHNDTTYNKKL